LPEFSDEDWISDFAFLVDMAQNLNDWIYKFREEINW
jgi:hypothetical protein